MGGKNSRDKTHHRASSVERDDEQTRVAAQTTAQTRDVNRSPGRFGSSGTGDGSRASAPPPVKGACRYFLSGYCRRGADCEYLHDESGSPAPAAAPPAAPASAATASATTPTTPNQRSPNKQHTIRTEEQALLLAMLNSLKDSLAAAKTSAERSAIYKDMRKAAAQYKQEQHRIREERQRARGERSLRNPSFGQQTPGGQPDQRFSPLKHVNFPTFPYSGSRFDQHREEGSEDRVECAICLCPYEENEEILVLPCLHWFHAKCAQQWMEKSSECPLCQHDILASLRDAQ